MSRVAKRLFILALGAYLALAARGRPEAMAAQLPAPTATGYAVRSGPLQLEMVLSPPVVAPGEAMDLILTATNETTGGLTPEVAIPIPDHLELSTGILPASTTYNFTTGTVSWQPFLNGQGAQERLSLRFRVGPAEIDEPVRTVSVYLDPAKGQPPLTASYWVGLPPTATLIVNPQTPAVGQPVQLLAQTGGTGPLTQVWETGDHRRLEAVDPVIVYPLPGTYEITLHVANPLAATTVRTSITVSGQPDAAFMPDDPTPTAGQPVRFVNQSGGQPPLQYAWSFGDGATSGDREPTHVFAAAGDYHVRLSVQGPAGQDTFTWPLTVGAPPQAQLILPATAIAGEAIVAQLVGDASIRQVRWDLGDGTAATGPVVRHLFLTGGDHYVRAWVENDYGVTEVGRWIAVEAGVTRSVYLPLLATVPLPQPEAGGAPAGPRPAQELGNVTAISTGRPEEVFAPIALEPAPLPADATAAELLFWYINEARRLHELPPLEYLHVLSIAAQRHAEDMAVNQFTGHRGSDGSMPFDRLPRHGFEGIYGGEATAWGFDEAREAVEFWVNSPGHRRIVLSRRAVSLGVGFVVDFKSPNVWYWVAEFGQRPEDEK